MNDAVREILCNIVGQRQDILTRTGRSVVEDIQLCEGLLRDHCGAFKLEISVLIRALEEGVAADLLASKDAVPRQVLLSRLSTRLQDRHGIREGAASWAVESWALALGVMGAGSVVEELDLPEVSSGPSEGDAFLAYQRAIELDPEDAEAHFNLGVVYGMQGQLDSAVRELQAALRLAPDHAKTHANLGVAYAKLGRLEEALHEYQAALRIDPDSAKTCYNLGLTYAKLGRLDEAIRQYQAALRRDRDNAAIQNHLGVAYARLGRLDDAIRQFKAILRLYPDYSRARHNLQWALDEQARSQPVGHDDQTGPQAAPRAPAPAQTWLPSAPGALQDTDAGLVIARPDNVVALLALPNSPQRIWWEKADMELRLVPAGEFVMGSPEGESAHDQHPQHTVYLDPYYIGRYPVTNAQYARFMQETGHRVPRLEAAWAKPYDYPFSPAPPWGSQTLPFDKAFRPVTLVSWQDALAYCEWAGLRLPTEAEWEKAARGTDARTYPWGDEDPTDTLCNFGYAIGDTTLVGKYSPQGDSPYGCADLTGNVREWVNDWYQNDYYGVSPYRNPQGPDGGRFKARRAGGWDTDWFSDYSVSSYSIRLQGRYKVQRGGGWDTYWADARAARRECEDPYFSDESAGFRCVGGSE